MQFESRKKGFSNISLTSTSSQALLLARLRSFLLQGSDTAHTMRQIQKLAELVTSSLPYVAASLLIITSTSCPPAPQTNMINHILRGGLQSHETAHHSKFVWSYYGASGHLVSVIRLSIIIRQGLRVHRIAP